jgi:hypothetical protein
MRQTSHLNWNRLSTSKSAISGILDETWAPDGVERMARNLGPGRHLDPPERALVLCMDEKSQIQALGRSQPVLPMMPGVANAGVTAASDSPPRESARLGTEQRGQAAGEIAWRSPATTRAARPAISRGPKTGGIDAPAAARSPSAHAEASKSEPSWRNGQRLGPEGFEAGAVDLLEPSPHTGLFTQSTSRAHQSPLDRPGELPGRRGPRVGRDDPPGRADTGPDRAVSSGVSARLRCADSHVHR